MLQLNRRLQNHAFESWKIGSSFVSSRSSLNLEGPVFLGAADAVDFVHTRAALLCNHIFCSQGRLFVVSERSDRPLRISEVTAEAAAAGQAVAPILQPIAGDRSVGNSMLVLVP